MKSKIAMTRVMISTGILAAGTLLAQTAQTAPAPVPEPNGVHQRRSASNRQDWMVQRLTRRLNLTADQQVQVKAILKDARDQNKAINAKVREERTDLRKAVETDSVAQIDKITEANAGLNAKVEANRLKTMAKIYMILNPDQRARFDQKLDHGRAGRQSKGV